MAVTFQVTDEFVNYVMQGDVALDATGSHSYMAALFLTAPTKAGTSTLASVGTPITNAGGYAAIPVTSHSYAETGAGTGIWQWSSPAFSWTAVGADFDSARYIVIYDDTHASDIVVGYLDYGAQFTVTEGNSLQITPGANGIFRITVS